MELPVLKYREEIISAVNDHSVVVITAETGAGKSTQVPQFLMEEGYQVVVTQPRRLATRTVAERVAQEQGCELGGLVGYRTAFEREDSRDTRCLFCTDGLQLVREITGTGNTQVLVIDEVHEWNLNIETLVAWARRQIAAGWRIKVVLMSATLEADRLAAFYGEGTPVIEVPGRLYPVEEKEDSASNLTGNVRRLVEEERNVLVFQPGKKEIQETCESLAGCGAAVLPLHGELDSADQKKCFRHYDGQPKVVVATNVAQTSVTIPDIDAVVDSGVERRVELVDGIEGLYLKSVSQADCRQRAGRAGRTKEGVYILCGDSLESRPAFPKAEVERSRLDQLVLRLANVGVDATDLEFFHQPDIETLREAKRALRALGAMAEDGSVTKTGRLMAKLPISVQFSRMIVEADRNGVVDDLITIAAILEIGGIRDRKGTWKEFVAGQTDSDVLAELELWNRAKGLSAQELPEMGIFKKAFFRVKELRGKIARSLKGKVRFGSTGERESIKRSLVAGMVDHLYRSTGGGDYRNGGNGDRRLDRDSVVTGNPDWIVGLPKPIEFRNRKGRLCQRTLVTMATTVDPRWLAEVAPQLVAEERGLSPRYDSEMDTVVSITRIYFQGQMIREEAVSDPEHPEAEKAFISALKGGRVAGTEEILEQNRQVRGSSGDLQVRSGGETQEISRADEQAQYELGLEGKGIVSAATLAEAIRSGRVHPNDLLLKLEDFIPASEQERIRTENPDSVEVDGEFLPVEYGRFFSEFRARTEISEEFARGAQTEGVTLPGGRQVEIRCSGHSAMTFHGLVAKMEKDRIDKAWRELRSELENRFWVYEPEKILPRLSELLSEVEITRTDNGAGEPITGFLSLASSFDAHPKFRIRISEDREEAEEETRKGLGRLLSAVGRDNLVVPQEEPWQVKSTGMFARWELTELGKALQSRFETLASEHADGLTPENFGGRLEALRAAAEEVKAEISGEHEDARRLLEETESEIEGKIEALEDRDFVETEIGECRELLRQAKSRLSVGAYGEVWTNCEQAQKVWQQAEGKLADRQARIDRGEILVDFRTGHRRGGVTGNGTGWVIRPDGSLRNPDKRDLRRNGDGTLVWNFVSEEDLALEWSCETMRDIAGSSDFTVVKSPVNGLTEAQREAVSLIELEDIGTTPNSFGLDPEAADRQAKVLAEVAEAFPACPTCGEKLVYDESTYRSMTGEYGFQICQDDHRISRLVNWNKPFDRSTEGREAQVIASQRISNGVIEALTYDKWGGWNLNLRWREMTAEEAAEPVEEPIPQGDGSFSEAGKRNFRCSCSGTTRVTKSDWKRYQSGEALELACPKCGAFGQVRREEAGEEKEVVGLDLSGLKAAWGA